MHYREEYFRRLNAVSRRRRLGSLDRLFPRWYGDAIADEATESARELFALVSRGSETQGTGTWDTTALLLHGGARRSNSCRHSKRRSSRPFRPFNPSLHHTQAIPKIAARSDRDQLVGGAHVSSRRPDNECAGTQAIWILGLRRTPCRSYCGQSRAFKHVKRNRCRWISAP